MQPRNLVFFAAATIAGVSACSGGAPFQPAASGSSSSGAAAPFRAPAATPTPSFYIYSTNYGSNDIAQVGFIPSSKQRLVQLAPNYALPSGCGPVAMAVVPAQRLAFVTCFAGYILPLKFTAQGTLTASKIKPVPVPTPMDIIATTTGAPNRLYAGLYSTVPSTSSNEVGGIAELSYTAKSLKLVKTYTAGFYPGQLGFHSGTGGSQLFVAAPLDSTSCPAGGAPGTVEVWKQAASGALAPQPSIPICQPVYNLVVSGDNLFVAGSSFLKGFALPNETALNVPAPPWAATGGGPISNPQSYLGTMVNVVDVAAPKNDRRNHGTVRLQFSTDNATGTVTFFNNEGKLVATIPAKSNGSGLVTFFVSTGLEVNGTVYFEFTMFVAGDDLELIGADFSGNAPQWLKTTSLGNEPQQVQFVPFFGK